MIDPKKYPNMPITSLYSIPPPGYYDMIEKYPHFDIGPMNDFKYTKQGDFTRPRTDRYCPRCTEEGAEYMNAPRRWWMFWKWFRRYD